ncbi:A disintegrin and metalloproteinase with thrombospondin motifs 20 [Drosophila mojavensis]|uniref:Uncharacterized protein, isoform C n=2 Tax=Drosophila mojavensis TaxID=7230 RepID=A0A0Q9XAU2_DROMO|nr:A disintegrin and metalloproteinase with thrombospondin motifs 20 [Drosophila mojavensis]XP_032589470.1 A disintegrin and metalloproteinase with thrombospondin motifs 20 [Drosophila mojavensis]KRG01112.1 uncharacterized protein Dmoj_GI24356, isoform C [Drosophila mojavensis]
MQTESAMEAAEDHQLLRTIALRSDRTGADIDADDSVLRYSLKGSPPELYSPKKEFIYTHALVEKQLVLKKTCEWWFYKHKNIRNMSTHWRQHALIWISVALLLSLFGLFIFFICGTPSDSSPKRLYEVEEPMNFLNDTIIINRSDERVTENGYKFDSLQYPESDNLSAFVTPQKIHNISLNAEDMLYESKRQSSSSSTNSSLKDTTSAFSMTGTFRRQSSQIWDPHPEYLLHVFGKVLHLMLHQDTSFIPSNTFRVIRILNNHTEESKHEPEEESGHFLGCYYKGYVDGDNQSAVAVSLCGGMTGYIKTSFGTMLIQPVNQTDSDQILHRVWRHSQRSPRHAVSDFDLELAALDMAASMPQRLTRQKRHFPNLDNQVYTLEVLIAVDSTMFEFHGKDLRSYILTLFSIVSNIFADASIGYSIKLSLLNLVEFNSDAHHGPEHASSTNEKLNNFCSDLTRRGIHYDTSILITRDKICNNERDERCRTLGLAELGTLCKARSCSFVQDNGLAAAFTIAHELGHIFNMPHDDDDRCKPYNMKSGTLHIMSSVMGDNMYPWSWSKCSQHYVSEFLEKMDKSCLENTPSSYIREESTKQPGEIYSLDHQCRLIHGNQSTHCFSEVECKKLFCNANTHPNGLCRSSNLPWADGTPCNSNSKNGFWCQKGKCVPRSGTGLRVVHGGWGPWDAFTPCSLSCGGGVQHSRRECNNPAPQNGGKYCVGSRKKYRSCNTHNCPPGTVEPREQQCYDMYGKKKIPGVSPSSKWVPKYGLNTHEMDKCKLYCRIEDNTAYFLLKDVVTDGTNCNVDSFDKCVNGICRPAGCDNELNSIAKLDKCGVCEGRNDTCEEYTGNVYVSDLLKQKKPSQSLFYVATIPKGASNIVITQPGYPDQNYIVLSNDNHDNLLNNDKVVTPYPKKTTYAGVTLDYNGSNSTVERVNSTYSWKLTRDLIVKVISIDLSADKDQNTVLISYTYTLDKPFIAEAEVEIYRWQMPAWSSCDSLCQGTMHRQATCISTTQGLKVSSQFCEESAKPKAESRSCNTDCILTLNTTSISECSAACGELGVREKTFNCIQTFPDIQRTNIVDMSFCQAKFEIVRHEECREGCWNYTDWSTCTKTCGTGTQVREVRCYLNHTPVSDELCNPRTKYALNDLLRTCNMEPCRFYPDPMINQRSVIAWVTGEWGECSDWCKMNRTVTCSSSYGGYCPKDRMPKAARNCCHIKYVSEWEKCSVVCGSGIKRKLQKCARVYKSEVRGTPKRREYVADSFCKALGVRKPSLRKSSKKCFINCKWDVSEWTRCTKDCTEEYQTRYVHCEAWPGNTVDDRHCDAKKRPIHRKICTNCARVRTKVTRPCDCSGYEQRRSYYYDSKMRKTSRLAKVKCTPPPSCRRRSISGSNQSRAVQVRRAQTCADVQQMYSVYKDGEYTLQVGSRQVRIYCHQMTSRTPREYITVKPQENYSIYYEYKTRLIDSCPPASRAHEYANDQNSGRTHFAKLRLNISDLRIIENDFEFAESRGQRQALGSAGDCYNRNMNCPQGDFSISLEHTGFSLRPGTVWNTYGSRAVMHQASRFNTASTSRRAFCGGFCGRCHISPASGLYVDVL